MRRHPVTWRITRYPAGGAPSRNYAVCDRDAARRKLSKTLDVPLWTLR